MERMTRSIKIYLGFSDDDIALIGATQDLYAKAFSDYASFCIVSETTSAKVLQKEVYPAFRDEHPEFPSALLQSSRDQAIEAVKSWNSSNPKRKWKAVPRLNASCTMRYTLRGASLRGNLLTLSTVGKRIRTMVDIPEHFRERYGSWKFSSAFVGVDRKHRMYAVLSFTSEVPERLEEGEIVGIDRGIYYMAISSDGKHYRSDEIRKAKRRYAYDRRTLQAKGTRSAKRRLKKLSGRERRFGQDVNHCVSKAYADTGGVAVYVLEDLKGMHNLRKGRRRRGKKTRTWLSNWSYSDFEAKLRYKCEARGIAVETVNPRYTSQECSACHHADKDSRHKAVFHCTACGHTEHADMNAAKVIRHRYITEQLARQNARQAAVNQPDGWGAKEKPETEALEKTPTSKPLGLS